MKTAQKALSKDVEGMVTPVGFVAPEVPFDDPEEFEQGAVALLIGMSTHPPLVSWYPATHTAQ